MTFQNNYLFDLPLCFYLIVFHLFSTFWIKQEQSLIYSEMLKKAESFFSRALVGDLKKIIKMSNS